MKKIKPYLGRKNKNIEYMETPKKSVFELLDNRQAFIVGTVVGLLVLCTLGFFVMLGLYFSGNLGGGSVAGEKISGNYPKKFSACLDEGKMAAKVSADEQLGASLGVNGTPATFINGYLVSGALPYESIKQVIDAALAGKSMNLEALKDENGNYVKPVTIPELDDVIWRGNENAKVTLVEFSDFECPYCARFTPTIEKIVTEYKDKIRFTYRHFPLSFHQNAQKAAEAFECAKEQDKGWEMYTKLFALSGNQQLSVDNFKKAADEIGLK